MNKENCLQGNNFYHVKEFSQTCINEKLALNTLFGGEIALNTLFGGEIALNTLFGGEIALNTLFGRLWVKNNITQTKIKKSGDISSVWEGLAHPVRRNTSVLKFYSSNVSSRYFERYTFEKCLSKVNVQMHFNKLKEHFQDIKEVQNSQSDKDFSIWFWNYSNSWIFICFLSKFH